MIDRDKQFIFIQPPKTGTTSIVQWLSNNSSIDLEYSNQFKKHITAHTWAQTLDGTVFRNMFKFMFVRNPWDRFVSEYFYLKKLAEQPTGPIKKDPHTLKAKEFFSKYNYSFTDFVKYIADGWEDAGVNFPIRYLRDNTLVKYAAMNFPTHHGRFIVDYVGRLETLQQDFDQICNRLDITTGKLPHVNQSTRSRDWRSYYTDDALELVTVMYIEDIVRFGYYKELDITLTKKQKNQIPVWEYSQDV